MSTQLSSSVINTMNKSKFKKKGFIWLALLHHSPSGREVEARFQAGTWRQEPEQRPWKNSADWLARFVFLYQTWTTCPGNDSAHSGLCRPIAKHYPRKCPIDLSTGSSDRHIFSQSPELWENTFLSCKSSHLWHTAAATLTSQWNPPFFYTVSQGIPKHKGRMAKARESSACF